jgi:tRNA pseudouridine55 synthase
VSKGTYIRTLGEDIGEALGCGAHLSMLRRSRNRRLHHAAVHDAIEALEALRRRRAPGRAAAPKRCWQATSASHSTPGRCGPLSLSGLRRRVANGQMRRLSPCGATSGASFLGTAHITAGELIPGRLLSPIEIQQILLLENASTTCETTP